MLKSFPHFFSRREQWLLRGRCCLQRSPNKLRIMMNFISQIGEERRRGIFGFLFSPLFSSFTGRFIQVIVPLLAQLTPSYKREISFLLLSFSWERRRYDGYNFIDLLPEILAVLFFPFCSYFYAENQIFFSEIESKSSLTMFVRKWITSKIFSSDHKSNCCNWPQARQGE